jgi:hypothetical protein
MDKCVRKYKGLLSRVAYIASRRGEALAREE